MRSLLTVKNAVAGAFILAEAVLYIVFNVLAATGPDPIYLKYSTVLLCVAAALFFAVYKRGADGYIVFASLVCTAVSDLFILVLDKYYEVGLVTFIAAQSLYFARMYLGRRRWYFSLGVRLTLAAIALAVCSAFTSPSLIIVEVCLYVVMLACNLGDAILLSFRDRRNVVFAVGLALFLCCDVCVGLHNAKNFLDLSLSEGLRDFAATGMWAFYTPSQVAITLSSEIKNGGAAIEREN